MELRIIAVIVVSIFFFLSILMSIFPIMNPMSGHDAIMKAMTPYFIVYPFLILILTMAVFFLFKSLDADTRKKAVFLYVAVAYLFTMLTLHISCFSIKIVSS